jgi:hypothetical protein
METWKNKHPDFEYILWNEEEIQKLNLKAEYLRKVDDMSEINGKADIIRWEILYQYGGIFLDADSICIEKMDEYLLKLSGFAGYENESVRKGLVATGTMGFKKNHPLCRGAIEWILHNEISVEKTNNRAWKTVGPGLLTRLLQTDNYKDVVVFPSYYFLPIHYSGLTYEGHGKVYAHQEWGSTRQHYEIMNSLKLPDQLKTPSIENSVSVLISSYNTSAIFLKECLQSIKEQNGYFNIEIVWINDGSDKLHTELLERNLKLFEETTRFTSIIYKKLETNMGVGYCLSEGVKLCSYEIIFRMDSDDIMVPDRLRKQLEFIKTHNDCVLLGSNVQMFKKHNNEPTILLNITNHPKMLTWEKYKITKSHWFMNHPSICFKKSAILAVGNYNPERSLYEDFELELKILKKFNVIYNIEEPLLLYRIHDKQVTANGSTCKNNVIEKKIQLIDNLINT